MNLVLVRQGDKYGPEYLKQFEEYNPIVLDDSNLNHGLKGWWAKMELFSPEVKKYRPCVFLDLDVILTDDISDLFVEPEKLTMPFEWMGDKKGRGAQSSVMLIPENTDEIWGNFMVNPEGVMKAFHGDQDFLSTQDWDPLYYSIGSYRLHNKDWPIHKIVCFHGKPKPHEATGWARDAWNLIHSA